MSKADIIVIGAGIAGSSAAAELAINASVLLLEMESQPGYHATGRSAAFFSPSYGNAVVRAVTAASEPFFRAPPEGFSEAASWRPAVRSEHWLTAAGSGPWIAGTSLSVRPWW